MSENTTETAVGTGEALACYDCGLLYGGPGWCDYHIPDHLWLRISPTGHEGGVLCIPCIAARLVAAGIDGVPLRVTSGPWDWAAAGTGEATVETPEELHYCPGCGETFNAFEESHVGHDSGTGEVQVACTCTEGGACSECPSDADRTRLAGIRLRLDAHEADAYPFDRAALVKEVRWLLNRADRRAAEGDLAGMLERTEQQIHEDGGFIDRIVNLEQELSDARAAARAAEGDLRAAMEGARNDIRDRKREFIRLGADPQYLMALDDAWGLVSNSLRAALAQPTTDGEATR
jgi:hypothetical protein